MARSRPVGGSSLSGRKSGSAPTGEPTAQDDLRHMRRALSLAARARGQTSPNPMVGCVIVRGGEVLAEGYHRRAGTAHAEVVALRRLAPGGARGATVYVTLEPCNHVGRTGPCAVALVEAGVGRVVAAMVDPNREVAGGGVARLRRAGISVELGLCESEARRLNAGFVAWATTGRPRVTLKAAVSLDGRIAASSGDARWVSGEASRVAAHRLRAECDAILVGAGTVRADDPALTTRLPGRAGRSAKDPLRVILDGRLSTPPGARVVGQGTLIVAARRGGREAAAALAARGAEVLRLDGSAGQVDLGALLDELGRRGVRELLVEGGSQVHGRFLAKGLADRMVVFVAPKVIGAAGVPLVAVDGAATMSEAFRLANVSVRRVGDDAMIEGDVVRGAADAPIAGRRVSG